jgi:hypothetical protein
MNTYLYNAYLVLCVFFFAPEILAEGLPMKKVQTVETVWVPIESSEVESTEKVIEAVEIPENSQGAVPLFKEGSSYIIKKKPAPQVTATELPQEGLQIKTPEGAERPIIQVIYQGDGPSLEQLKQIEEAKKMVKAMKPEEPKGGDTYNFYFGQ